MVEHDLRAVAFPRLDESQMAAVEQCPLTALTGYRAGDPLFEAGAREVDFFVVESGAVEIVDDSADTSKTVAVHGPGEFTGDAFQLTGSPSLFSGVARGDCGVYRVSPDALRQILNNHPDLGDVILQALVARRQLVTQSGTFTGLRVIGSRYSRDTFRIRDFLAKNRLPFTWLDLEAESQVDKLLQQFGLTPTDTPVVAWGRRLLLRNPSDRELAEALGIRRPLEQTVYDLVVVGAGPAGLAAAVYGASEGLKTVVLERTGPGGQAGRSMRIENYLGFPTGITGGELAERAVVQASKFGARLPTATLVTGLTFDHTYPRLRLDGGETVTAKCVLIATGADYRRLTAEGCERFEGCGVYYAATFTEAQMCKGSDVVVVGGGNSAGQAAVFLSAQSRTVHLVIRREDLGKNMSAYLVRRIEDQPNIEVLRTTEVRRMSGDLFLGSVEVVNTRTGEVKTLAVQALFSFIGAIPRTDWLPPEIERDGKDFVRTGPGLSQSARRTAGRQPFLLETSHPGVFAAGDVRSDSVKRVASAVGEGAMAVQFVHQYLSER